MSKTRFLAIALLLLMPIARAQDLPQIDGHMHLGVATCASSQCHGSAVARTGANVLQSEYVSWTNDDPHAGAFQTLTTTESAAIAMRLGLGNAAEADECLDCHADHVPPARRGERFQLSDGVGCEACHGGAENWLVAHYNDPDAGHEDNVAAGLYPADLRSRATLCLSCHLGTEDKFASHSMMAAGHPRLTFELDTFTELWRLAGNPPHFIADDDYAARKAEI
ncbi:MAG: multiheme c-type cytochrome, partial [Gammaproteobacteria bacterium]|nr:multiheme c-type cytochrome [Gammaproteobacteria bacterium]